MSSSAHVGYKFESDSLYILHMQSLPPELVAQIFPDARGIVALKNTCKWLRGRVGEILRPRWMEKYASAGGGVAKYGCRNDCEIKTRAYTIICTNKSSFPQLVGPAAPVAVDTFRGHGHGCGGDPQYALDSGGWFVSLVFSSDYAYACMLFKCHGIVHKLKKSADWRECKYYCVADLVDKMYGPSTTNVITCAGGEMRRKVNETCWRRDGVSLGAGGQLIVGQSQSCDYASVRTSDARRLQEWFPQLCTNTYTTTDAF